MSLKVKVPVAWFGPGALVHHATVVCDGGRVTYAGPSAAAPPADDFLEVDGFLMPGVVDRHVHIRLADPGAVLLGGVTAVRDLAWVPDEIFELANASELPTFTGPVIRAAGAMLTAPGGYPTASSWAPPGTGRELAGPEDAAAAVAELTDQGAAAIKVSLNGEAGPTPSDAELAAIVQAAHERALPVTAHVQGTGQAERALGAGMDEFAHTPGNGAIPAGIHLREALLLSEAVRMTPEEVLTAMTAGPLAVDGPADLIVLGSDPLMRLEALGDLRVVVRAGKVVSG